MSAETTTTEQDTEASPDSVDVEHVSALRVLEAEAVHIIREVAAELERPVLLFSGGKDSIVLLRLAEKAFRPHPLPFPILHVDTCLLYTSPSPRDGLLSRMPSSA